MILKEPQFMLEKTEVIQVGQLTANLASNNSRQIYAQISGLNIYQNDDAGLQLNIGGRGLDPNRTSNFNTRQNGYDISADVLGYPESYYSPRRGCKRNSNCKRSCITSIWNSIWRTCKLQIN